jgi:hypothetical protein
MSIFGRRITSLSPAGVPGRLEGLTARTLMINVELMVQLAGDAPNSFLETERLSPSQIVQQGDGGINVVLTVVDAVTKEPIDLSAATGLTLLLQKPDLTTFSFSASLLNNGYDGKMAYALNASVFDQAGYYWFQGSFAIGGIAWYTIREDIKVLENIVVVVP